MRTLDKYPGRNPNLDHYLLKQQTFDPGNDMEMTKQRMVIRKVKTQWKIVFAAAIILVIVFGIIVSQRVSLQRQALVKTDILAMGFPLRVKHKQVTHPCENGECVSPRTKTADDDYAEYFIPSKKKTNPMNYDFVIRNDKVCSRHSPYVIVLVPSSISNVRERQAVRSTWGSISRGKRWPNQNHTDNVKLIFLVGRSKNKSVEQVLKNESIHYGDIVQADFLDSYQNLSIKVLMGIKWVSLFCSDSKFILKADDDTFVNLPYLTTMLKDYDKIDRLGVILGHLNEDAQVKRYGRWKVADDIYPFPHFPPYVFGNSYVISSNIASRIFSASEYMPFIPIEDAFITGVLAKVIDTKLIHVSGFTFLLDLKPKYCDFVNDIRISGTHVSAMYMYFIWDKLHSNDISC